MVQIKRTARELYRYSSLSQIRPVQPNIQQLRLGISRCVVNVPMQPMVRMERAARELFRSSSLSQIRSVQPNIQLYHHQFTLNLAGLVLFSDSVIMRMRACAPMTCTLPITYTGICWCPSISYRECRVVVKLRNSKRVKIFLFNHWSWKYFESVYR